MKKKISPLNESRTGFFILQNFWPVFKLFQILGVFPCKKVTDENGVIQLQPMKKWMSIIFFSTWWVIFIAIIQGIFFYLESQTGIMMTFFYDHAAKCGGATRLFVVYFMMVSYFIIQVSIFQAFVRKRMDLCRFQADFSDVVDTRACIQPPAPDG